MTTCAECDRRRRYMAADRELYRGDDTRCDAHRPSLRTRGDSAMTALAPCPGCGAAPSQATHVHVTEDRHFASYYRARCDCGWSGPPAGTEQIARAQWNLRAPPLRWRREPPDVPGWWWHRHAGMHSHWRCSHYDARECVDMREYADPRVEWAGPIPEPEEGE